MEDPVTGSESHAFSTVQAINMLTPNGLGVPLIKTRTTDWNRDGKLDSLEIELQFQSLPGRGLPLSQSIRGVRLVGSVDYELDDTLQMKMVGLFSAYLPTPSGASTIHSSGSLELNQQAASQLSSHAITTFDTNPFDDMAAGRFNL